MVAKDGSTFVNKFEWSDIDARRMRMAVLIDQKTLSICLSIHGLTCAVVRFYEYNMDCHTITLYCSI